jgi:hypothetical protein
MFDEYEFLEYCEEQYLNGLCQEDAHEQQRAGTVSDTVKEMPTWQLICWLGEYTQKK